MCKAVYILRRALIIPEKRVVYVVSIVAYQDYQDRNWMFRHTRGTECACAQYCAKRLKVEVHGWLLSGSEEDYTLLLFFDCCS